MEPSLEPPQWPIPWSPPRRLPRAHSRRGEPRFYLRERLGRDELTARHRHRAPDFVAALADAGRTGSAFRRLLKANDIDPKLARLMLLFEGFFSLRVADVAWELSVSPSTASRWLDRAEREGLVDKFYSSFDRRGTWARITRRGVELRTRAQLLLASIPTNARPAGVVYGIRGTPGWDEG
jgi:DNA-binding MarR family transcriptional regulator